ncbi:MAG: hypothetical protein ACK41U_10235, partial [Paracoccus sp. (in: a-proteobacteria)]|uniref:hypothetical protein n=1 Tax=Paracoccus sp. TaxID=267 RepID=UPI00391A3511
MAPAFAALALSGIRRRGLYAITGMLWVLTIIVARSALTGTPTAPGIAGCMVALALMSAAWV